MYNVEKLLSIVCDALDAEDELRKYNLKVRRQRGLQPGDSLWVPSLDGETACRLGELCERCNCCWGMLSDICGMLDIDWKLLIAAVKSMRRKERHNGRWDNPDYTCWMWCRDKERLMRFLSKGKDK